MAKDKLIRINFQLPRGLSVRFDSHAKKCGITKSSLLRKQINSDRPFILVRNKRITKRKMTSIHFLATKLLVEKIDSLACEYSLNRTSILNMIIKTLLHRTKTNNANSTSSINNLENMEIDEMNTTLENKIETLSAKSIYLYAKLNTNHGNQNNTIHAINILEQMNMSENGTTTYTDLQINTLKAEMAISNNCLDQATIYNNNVFTNPYVYNSSELLGTAYYQQGRMYIKREMPQQAYVSLIKAVECFNIITNPLDIATTYIFLALLGRYGSVKVDTEKLFARSKFIIESTNNKSPLGWYYCHYGSYLLTNNHPTKAVDVLNKGIKLNAIGGSPKQLYWCNLYIAKAMISNRKYSGAMKMLDKCQDNEKQFRENVSISSIYKKYIRSQDNYVDSMNTMIESQQALSYRGWNSYIIYCAQFLHSNDYKESEKGAHNLQQLAQTAKYPTLRKAAKETLNTRTPQLNLI